MSKHPTVGGSMGGRYTLTERIAAGGMGEVWQAKDDILGRSVALKVLKSGLTDETGFTERFRNEARLSAALTHGNIAQVYDYGEDDGTAYLVMEYVPGRPLSKLIEERAPMSPIDTVEIVAQAASALQAAHKNGLIHRDVKPANILIDPDGTAKLTDFGIARAADAVAMTKTGEVMGTAQYLAPEAAVGRPATGLSDVYALGVVAYEMLAGRRPFEADTAVALALAHVNEPPPPLPPYVPPTIRAVVHASLEKDPRRRPQSAAEFGRAMRQALRDADRMGMLGTAPPRGPMGSQGPRALSPEQRAQRHPGPTSGPHSGPQGAPGRPPQGGPGQHGPRGPQSGPQPTGPHPAGPSGPQGRGPHSGPQPTGPVPAGGSGPQHRARMPGAVSGPQPTGPQPAGTSGPNRQHGGPHGQSGPQAQLRGGQSGPQSQVRSGPQQQLRSTSGPQQTQPVRRSGDGPGERSGQLGGSATATSTLGGISRGKLIAAGVALLALIAVVVLVIVLSQGGDDSPGGGGNSPSNPVNTGPFETPFTPVSMPGDDVPDRSEA